MKIGQGQNLCDAAKEVIREVYVYSSKSINQENRYQTMQHSTSTRTN